MYNKGKFTYGVGACKLSRLIISLIIDKKNFVTQSVIILQVSTNGVVSFGGPFYEYDGPPVPDLFYFVPVIAPFFADSDTSLAGEVFYRYTDNETLLEEATSCIRDAFDSEFSPTVLFIATWNGVAAFGGSQSVVSKE